MRLTSSTICLLGLGLLSVAKQAPLEDNKPIFICPLPRCGKCPSKERISAPGVGFALELGYGTASIYNNGTVTPVAKVKGTAEYTALMQDLATGPIKRMSDGSRPPPGVDESDDSTWFLWMWFRIRRLLNKLLFRPATSEIRILAEMVSNLRLEVEAQLGRNIKGAALASPDRVRLTSYEITDIFAYLHMEDLVRDKHNPIFFSELFSMAAALAGYGQGLCVKYTNAYQCAKEESYFPTSWILQLDYSNHSLSGAMELSDTARRDFSHNSFVDLALGSVHLRQNRVREPEYLVALATRIRKFVGSRRAEILLLTGESALEPRFINTVRDALSSRSLPQVLSQLEEQAAPASEELFLYATSMGAAEFAKRRQEGMARCQLPERCRGRMGSSLGEEDVQEL